MTLLYLLFYPTEMKESYASFSPRLETINMFCLIARFLVEAKVLS